MTNRRNHFRLALLVAILSLTLIACTPQLGTSWAGLTPLADGTSIAFAYEDTLSIVSVADGDLIPLIGNNGQPQINSDGSAIGWAINGNDFENARFFAPVLPYTEETFLVSTLDRRLLQIDSGTASVLATTDSLTEGTGNAVTPLVAAGDKILMGLQQRLVALESDTLQLSWEIATEHGVWAEPTVLDGVAYFTSLDHNMYAVDVDTGNELWRVDLIGASTSTPAYYEAQDVFFVGTFDNTILKISRNGDIVDEYTTEEWVWGSPRLVDGMLYVADLAGFVYKLDPETLTEQGGWKARVATEAIRTPPLVYDDLVVVGSRDQHVYWVNRDNGAVNFERQLDGEVLADILYFPANDVNNLEESLIVVSTQSNRESLVALTATQGERVWTYRR